jgi:RHS repeat-associated protein
VDTSATSGTVSGWVKVSALDSNGVVLGYGGAVSTDPALWGVYIREVSGNYYFAMSARKTNGGAYNTVRGSTPLASGTWYYVTYSSNGSSWKIRVNGAATETLANVLGTNTGDWIGDISPATPDKSDIGGVYAGGAFSSVNFWHGILDEVRLSNVERSNDWVTTEYNNQNSPATFYSVSSATSLTVTSQVNWLVTDHLGTPRIIIDQTGSLANVKRHDYLPFGEELSVGAASRSATQGYGCAPGDQGCTADKVRQQFVQKERDVETSLDYSVARYYLSTQGRFSSVDPLLASAVPELPQSWNRYASVLNNPLVYIDPTGELWVAADDTGTRYNWVDTCPEGATCYESIAVANESSVLIYGSRDQNDLTMELANENGLIDLSVMATHPDSQFESAAGPANDPETYLNPTNAAALFNATRMYHDAHPNDDRVVVTGASNSEGESALDSNGAPIHGTHRNGENIDIRYIDANGQSIRGPNAYALADPLRMSSLWGAFRSQTPGLGDVYTGNQARFGLPTISKKLENQHKNHFHLYRR